MNTELIYLDHAAATPLDERVLTAMQPYFSEFFFNPSSPYKPALDVRHAYEAAKSSLAHTIGAKGDELVMTAGATESINLLFSSIEGHIVTSTIEHDAVLRAVEPHEHSLVVVDERGRVDPMEVKRAIQPNTQLVSIQLANNELGTIQPLRDIAIVVKAERQLRLEKGNQTPIYFHSDASQGAGQIDINVARLGLDAITLNAGKIYGPKQVGLLWTDRQLHLHPYIVGGGQERGLRSGTENVAGVIGFAKAFELAQKHRASESERLHELRDTFENDILTAFPRAVASGHRKHRLPGHAHLSFPGIDAERLVFALEAQNVLVATGSACAANKGTRSHVLTAIGLSPEVADGSLRFTFGHLSTKENTSVAAGIIISELKREYKRTQL